MKLSLKILESGQWLKRSEVAEKGQFKCSDTQLTNALTALLEQSEIERDPKETKSGAHYRYRLSKPNA